MAFERPIAGAGPGAEPAPVPVPSDVDADRAEGVTAPMRLQVLSTEHWSLLASRSLAWNESFSRAGMFLTTLSGSIVALALVAQASSFDESFRLFALVILPVVLFVGIGTVLRLGIANQHDAMCVIGMNRIRAGYLEMAPDLRRFFVTGTSDDMPAVRRTMGIEPTMSIGVQMLASTPLLISVLNSVLLAAIGALAVLQLVAAVEVALGVAAIGFSVGMAAHQWYAVREIGRAQTQHEVLFPPPDPS